MIDSLDLRTLQKESARALIVMQNADNLSLSEINQKAVETLWKSIENLPNID